MKNNIFKRFASAASAAVIGFTMTCSFPAAADETADTKGDINNDGQITSIDVSRLLSYINQTSTPTEKQKTAADLNSDGNLDALDYYIYDCCFTNYNSDNYVSLSDFNKRIADFMEFQAESVTGYGMLGEKAAWVLTEQGELKLFGSGDITGECQWNVSEVNGLTIGSEISSIPRAAFAGYTELVNVYFETRYQNSQNISAITELPENIFSDCTSLTEVSLPESIKTIGDYAFARCTSLNNIGYYQLETIGSNAFEGCTSLEYAPLANDIYNHAFEDCTSLKTIDFSYGEGSITIGEGAYSGCSSVETLTISDRLVSCGSDAFSGLTSLNTVNVYSDLADTGLTAVHFSDCKNLTKVSYGTNVDDVDLGYWSNSTKINDVIINNKDAVISGEVNLGGRTPGSVTIEGYTPSTAKTFAEEHGYNFKSLGELFETVVDGDLTYAIYEDRAEVKNCATTAKGKITIPSEINGLPVTAIKDFAFSNCALVTDVDIPDSITSLGENAFYRCTSLSTVELPESITVIPGSAFCASGLMYITIPDSIRSIEGMAFSSCYYLKSVVIPRSVTNISYSVFDKCEALESVRIENPYCSIYSSENVFADATIYGYVNSTAQAYAEKYEKNFVLIEVEYPETTSTTTTTRLTTTTTTTSYNGTTDKATTTSNNLTTPVPTTTTKAATTTTTTTTVPAITLYIGQTIKLTGVESASNSVLSVDGDNITGLRAEETVIKVNGSYKDVKILKPDLKMYINDVIAENGCVIDYEEGTKIKFVLSNFYPDAIENSPSWNISEMKLVDGEEKFTSANWSKLHGTPTVEYYSAIHSAMVEFTLTSKPAQWLNGRLGWHIANNNNIYFDSVQFTLAAEEVCGDANRDGSVKLNDAVLIMQAISNPNKFGIDGTDELHITETGWANADCNAPGDGVTGKDALAIQKLTLQLIDSLPEE